MFTAALGWGWGDTCWGRLLAAVRRCPKKHLPVDSDVREAHLNRRLQTPLFLQLSVPGDTAQAMCKGSHVATDRPETGQDLWRERCSAVGGGTAPSVPSGQRAAEDTHLGKGRDNHVFSKSAGQDHH